MKKTNNVEDRINERIKNLSELGQTFVEHLLDVKFDSTIKNYNNVNMYLLAMANFYATTIKKILDSIDNERYAVTCKTLKNDFTDEVAINVLTLLLYNNSEYRNIDEEQFEKDCYNNAYAAYHSVF